jgi:hypothetical protein
MHAFAVVIQKTQLRVKYPARSPRDVCWEFLIQRLDRHSTKSGTPVMIVHDEGNLLAIRKLARKARRAGTAGSAFGMGYLNVPARLLVDDPIPRQSHQSYFLQLADLVACAAFRKLYPPPVLAVPTVVPQGMWDELRAAKLTAATSLKGAEPGLVSWP